MEDGTLTVPVIHAGTNFLCAGRNMKRYTKEDIEQLSKNPIVRSVNEKRLVLTFEFRVKMGIKCIMETRATSVTSRYRPEPEPIPCEMINCFCMFSDYQPMTLDEWIEIDRNRREGMNG